MTSAMLNKQNMRRMFGNRVLIGIAKACGKKAASIEAVESLGGVRFEQLKETVDKLEGGAASIQ